MENLPILQSKEISQVRQPVSSGLEMPTMWQKLASVTAGIADDFEKDAAAANAKRLAEMETNIERQAIDMRNKFDNDPKGFDAEWTKFSAQMIGNTEAPLHADLKLRLEKEGNQQYGSLLSERRSRDRQNAADSLGYREDAVTNQLLSIAGTKGVQDPEYQEKYKELEGILQSQVNAGLRGGDYVSIAMNRATEGVKQEVILGTARKAYEDGDVETVASLHDDLINGTLLPDVAPNKRRALANMIQSDISSIGAIQEAEQNKKDKEARSIIKQERENAQREYVDLTAQGKMTQDWIQENKGRLSPSLYAKAVNDYGYTGAAPISSDKLALDDIEAISDEDLDAAIPVATQHYAAGRLSLDDLKNTIEATDARKQKPVDEKERSRLRIRESLKTPQYLKTFSKDDPAKSADAVRQFDDWISKNPDASDDDIEKRAETIIGKYRTDALSVLPSPYGSAIPKNKVTEVTIGQGFQKIKDAYENGKISKDDARREAEALNAWKEYLRGSVNGQ
ncbi:MAG: hypothetical protein E6R03_10595 [Hyphomicrobiaceae bacterium]|nr:MAG: hypothetical protein E6R03_10595 [Hyphomicrobiaceae bacterium]